MPRPTDPSDLAALVTEGGEVALVLPSGERLVAVTTYAVNGDWHRYPITIEVTSPKPASASTPSTGIVTLTVRCRIGEDAE